ncbi:PepSY domain-containing protein [Desulfobacter curvatus]|uniref:PepSY domain-containing protein n=1 Tax=Desulfobacter curvatus TaxID=2290 RepID=UPI00037B2D63|nr:PepSY domain-containing protein [Desulfobacter curvatus]
MKKRLIVMAGAGTLFLSIAVAGVSLAGSDKTEIRNGTIRIEKQSEAEFPSMAKISMDQAVQQALASVQGRVLKTELEDENGFLVYGIEVVTADKAVMDVKVDAGSGKVLAMERDHRDDDEDRDAGEDNDRGHED